MKNTNSKLLVLALVGLFLTNCQRDDAPEVLPQQEPVPTVDPQAVVSLDEAKSLFEASENQKRTANSVSRRKYPFIELETDWRYFVQTQTLVGDAYSKIPVTIVGSDLSAEILFLKKDGITEQTLFVTKVDSLTSDNRIVNADFYLFTPKGEFISAYRMKEGVITHELVPKYKGRYRLVVDTEVAQTSRVPKARTRDNLFRIACDCGTESNSEGDCGCAQVSGGGYSTILLDEVTLYGKRKKRLNNPFDPYPNYNDYEFTDPYYDEDFYRGGRYRGGECINCGGGGGSNVGAGMAKEEQKKKEEKKEDKREDTIKDSLTNPCAKALLAQAPNLNNDIAKILRETFGTNDRFNITVHNKSFATDPKHKKDVAYTETIGRVDSYNKDILICDIYLNDDIISKASQEYILGTIYHEVVHAFLNTESLSLGKESFNKKYPFVKEQYLSIGGEQVRRYVFLDSHERFAPFIDNLARGILSLPNTKVSMEEAIALAKAGVVENKSLSSTEIYLDGEFKSGRKGITCTP
ncbi:hypothetical protein [Capnocytophaga genosp. AHN8471]|uniref:hypothetical protein n=1 Tax=Capnocytophaga genosp. AHN8471 TaxID=327574 RepID=UPI0019334002|nr:hypothetical protein [Capnocytophaga genosp. AHN8471]MBM0658997.1 hypothetical protein [Capnocytophaga genosp. AHN8471]